MTYSIPTEPLPAFELQARTRGTCTHVFSFTVFAICQLMVLDLKWLGGQVPYLKVATSDVVIKAVGPANCMGTFATTFAPLSSSIMNTRLNPPSLFSQATTSRAPLLHFTATSSRALKLKSSLLAFCRCSSRSNQRPRE
jgi:hypothetical protein